jgi:hypothetical protein
MRQDMKRAEMGLPPAGPDAAPPVEITTDLPDKDRVLDIAATLGVSREAAAAAYDAARAKQGR